MRYALVALILTGASLFPFLGQTKPVEASSIDRCQIVLAVRQTVQDFAAAQGRTLSPRFVARLDALVARYCV